jgi:hypothetical protein
MMKNHQHKWLMCRHTSASKQFLLLVYCFVFNGGKEMCKVHVLSEL